MLPVWLTDTVTPDLDRALHYTLLWGLEGVVLRSVGSHDDRVPHVNEAKLKRRLAEHEVPAVAVDPGLFEGPAEDRGTWMNDLVLLPDVLAFCRRIGCPTVLVGALPGDERLAADALRRAADAAARQGLQLAVQNGSGQGDDGLAVRATGRAVAALLDAVGRPNVRACWRPADAIEAGEAAFDGIEALGDRVALVIVRDGVPTGGGWATRPLGEGAVGWEGVLRALGAGGYDGPLCLDLSDLAAAKDGLHEATALIRLIRQARRG